MNPDYLLKFLPQQNGDNVNWGEVHGPSASYYLTQAYQQAAKPYFIVCPDAASASQLASELQFFAKDTEVLLLPDWEILPYDHFSPHHDLISERIHCFSSMKNMRQGFIIASIGTLLHRLAPPQHLLGNNFNFKLGDILDLTEMRKQLVDSGYRLVTQVQEHGEFAVRGAILDLYPMGLNEPLRIELLDDEIDSIRAFDPDNQCSTDKLTEINLLSAREYPIDEQGIKTFRQQWRENFAGDPMRCPIYENISNGIALPGIEYYLPLFFEQCADIFAYLPDNACAIRYGDCQAAAHQFQQHVQDRYEQLNYDIERPLLPPDKLFLKSQDFFAGLNQLAQIQITKESARTHGKHVNLPSQVMPSLLIDNKHTQPLTLLNEFLDNNNTPVLLCAETAGRQEILAELLRSIGKQAESIADWQTYSKLTDKPKLAITIVPLSRGMLITEEVCLIAETQLFGHDLVRRRRDKKRVTDPDAIIRNLAELQVGSPIVHIEHGVGRYLGLQTLSVGGQTSEFVTIEYADGDKLYVPVNSLHMINRYQSNADSDNAPLHRLGSDQWSKVRAKAEKKVYDVAAELLQTYAERAARQGYAFPNVNADYQQFAEAFPFVTTPDQEQAIAQVIADMTSAKPMDRLVCGDVGFGKTEVAMRAAFIAAYHHKQVAMLVPTTLLAQQHYESFRDRFANTGISIAMVSRFLSQKEQQKILSDLEAGKVDIIIGTHKLLQSSIKFKDLGLLIIDEEHRFGVKQKEKLKALRADVDILALTATPIPRTLNMAFASIRDLSIIATPPERRLAIKTFVHQKANSLIKEAISRELMRGGQVYYLQNNVEQMPQTLRELQALLPEANFAMAHGQLPERELEAIMVDFYHHRVNVLICSTIIETGIDVPAANTIIMERADKLGLAQLHQLRGRVGRSHHQAYAYLLTPEHKKLSKDAEQRLDAISAFEDLGAGFTLATHDLEIRGAGDLLGADQSGHIHSVGFALYMELLERAVKQLQRGGKLEGPAALYHPGAEIDLQLTSIIPDDYLPDINIRLSLYKRIANADNEQDLKDIQVEMIDRFGLLPEPTKYLFRITALKIQAQPIGIQKIEAGNKGGKFKFIKEPNIDPQTVIKLIQNPINGFKFSDPQTLRFSRQLPKIEDRFTFVANMLDYLKPSTSPDEPTKTDKK